MCYIHNTLHKYYTKNNIKNTKILFHMTVSCYSFITTIHCSLRNFYNNHTTKLNNTNYRRYTNINQQEHKALYAPQPILYPYSCRTMHSAIFTPIF